MTWLLLISLWVQLWVFHGSKHNYVVWKRFIRQSRCFRAFSCSTLRKQIVFRCGDALMPEYLERWFNISMWLPACNNVALIDWIYSDALTQLEALCAVQLNRSWKQGEGLWHPLVSCVNVFCHCIQPNALPCLCLPHSGKRLTWPLQVLLRLIKRCGTNQKKKCLQLHCIYTPSHNPQPVRRGHKSNKNKTKHCKIETRQWSWSQKSVWCWKDNTYLTCLDRRTKGSDVIWSTFSFTEFFFLFFFKFIQICRDLCCFLSGDVCCDKYESYVY